MRNPITLPNYVVLWVTCNFGISWCVDWKFEPPGDGYFMRPISDKNGIRRQTTDSFYVPRPLDTTILEASYGPFAVRQAVPSEFIQDFNKSVQTSFRYGHHDLSAHLLNDVVYNQEPDVLVFGHLGVVNLHGNRKIKGFRVEKWCLQVEIQHERHLTSSACVLTETENTCLTKTRLPKSWWNYQKASIYYIVFPISEDIECSSGSNFIVPGKAQSDKSKRYLGDIKLLDEGRIQYREIREDQHILLDVPQKPVYPGSQFKIPVKLQAESDLQLFVVRVKTRFGLRVVNAVPMDPNKWQVTVDVNHKQRGAMITAFVKDARSYAKTASVQDIFHCVFEVDNRTDGQVQDGRVVWTLEYDISGNKMIHYGDPYNKVITRISIQHDQMRTIVAVVKENEILNTAMLTGQTQLFPISVYGISKAGNVIDVTSKAACYSLDEQVLKVTPPCSSVFLDSTTSRGARNVSVVVKYGYHSQFVSFRVWIPEFPLDVNVEDSKLSQIKGWKVYNEHDRKTRGVDFGLLTYPGVLLKDEGKQPEISRTCRLRYQQSQIKVYARFYAANEERKEFLVSRKAFLDITDVVHGRMRVTDISIASLQGTTVQGKMPGRTEVQVMLPSGHIAGAKEIRVGTDKVSISRLVVNMVSGLTLNIGSDKDLDGTYVAGIHVKRSLHAMYQEALLDLSVQFSDNTVLPLHQVDKNDYHIDTNTLNNHVIVFGPKFTNDQLRVIAVGEGKGELVKVMLDLSETCQRRKSRSLAVSYVYVNVDFSADKNVELQNDGHFGEDNRASDRWDLIDTSPDEKVKKGFGKKTKDKKDWNKEMDSEIVDNIPLDIDLGNLPKSQSAPESKIEPGPEAEYVNGRLTPLEIGMYVLLGVFSLAITVFLVNCAVYFVRYKRKRVSYSSTESLTPAREWVWIGHQTLERNLIRTHLSQTLMPEADFNGNRSVATRASSASNLEQKRNSGVSTYQGSECSIRITSNPLDEVSENKKEESQNQQKSEMDEALLAADYDIGEITDIDAESGYNLGDLTDTDVEYDAMEMTPEQFSQYFANLKESVA